MGPSEEFIDEHRHMVDAQLIGRGIHDERVIAAARRVQRHRYVPTAARSEAYADTPLPIGHGATISQPYIVALMAQELRLDPTDRVLEVGTGSGYGAAILAELTSSVVTVETIPELAAAARARLADYGDRVDVVDGDGSLGWPERAPYDAICVTAAAPSVPPPLLQQLAEGGRLVAPIGHGVEELVRLTTADDQIERCVIGRVRFVPLVGQYGSQRHDE